VDYASHVGKVYSRVVHASQDGLDVVPYLVAVGLNQEVALALKVSTEGAELHHYEVAAHSPFHNELEGVLPGVGTSQHLHLVRHLGLPETAKHARHPEPSRVSDPHEGFEGSVLAEHGLAGISELVEEKKQLSGEVVAEFSVGLLGEAVEGHVVHVVAVYEEGRQGHLGAHQLPSQSFRNAVLLVDRVAVPIDDLEGVLLQLPKEVL
jgi:hypothetical protein